MNTAQRLEGAEVVLGTRSLIEDGQELVSVPLKGARSTGRRMILDSAVWHAGRASGWPAAWALFRERKSERDYVVTRCGPIAKRGQIVYLARLVAGADAGDVVVFRNGDPLDMRRSNLLKMPRAKFMSQIWTASQWKQFVEVEEDTGDEV